MSLIRINLLQRRKTSLSEKLVYFVLHYLRYIIVLTQIVVISVFFLRFKLDQEIVDLRESVAQKQEILRVTKPLVEEVRAVSKKTHLVRGLLQKQENTLDIVTYVLSNIPSTVTIQSLKAAQSEVEIVGVSIDIPSISLLFKKLRNSNYFKESIIGNVAKKNTGFEFLITLKK